jgi:carbon monoxide dehydrogenase subunit G
MPRPLPEFGGEESFAAKPAQLYALLTDLDAIGETIPDRVSSQRSADGGLECVVRPGFAFLRGTLKLKMTLDELAPPSAATMRVQGNGIGVDVQIVSTMRIAPHDDGSRLAWTAQIVALKGLVATVSSGLIAAAADQVMRQGWRRIRERLESQPAT